MVQINPLDLVQTPEFGRYASCLAHAACKKKGRRVRRPFFLV